MSPRAAWRLRSLGYDTVFDYTGGVSDWIASGGKLEGHATLTDLVGDHVESDVARISFDATVDNAREALEDTARDLVVVTNDDGVVFGKLRAASLEDAASDTPVASVMQPGPATVRASEARSDLTERMKAKDVTEILVTRPDGVLLGVFAPPA